MASQLSESAVVNDGLNGKTCYECNSNWDNCTNQSEWMPCEECDNWVCFVCSPRNFEICNICKLK